MERSVFWSRWIIYEIGTVDIPVEDLDPVVVALEEDEEELLLPDDLPTPNPIRDPSKSKTV